MENNSPASVSNYPDLRIAERDLVIMGCSQIVDHFGNFQGPVDNANEEQPDLGADRIDFINMGVLGHPAHGAQAAVQFVGELRSVGLIDPADEEGFVQNFIELPLELVAFGFEPCDALDAKREFLHLAGEPRIQFPGAGFHNFGVVIEQDMKIGAGPVLQDILEDL